jgi:hypothetical protein
MSWVLVNFGVSISQHSSDLQDVFCPLSAAPAIVLSNDGFKTAQWVQLRGHLKISILEMARLSGIRCKEPSETGLRVAALVTGATARARIAPIQTIAWVFGLRRQLERSLATRQSLLRTS